MSQRGTFHMGCLGMILTTQAHHDIRIGGVGGVCGVLVPAEETEGLLVWMAVGLITCSPSRTLTTRTEDLLVSSTEHSSSEYGGHAGSPSAVWTIRVR